MGLKENEYFLAINPKLIRGRRGHFNVELRNSGMDEARKVYAGIRGRCSHLLLSDRPL
jgi:hypothetical protein